MAYNPNQPRASDGKWGAGGGGESGAHAGGVKHVGQPTVSSQVLAAVKGVRPGSGVSISLAGTQPKSGYMVSSHPERTKIVNQRDLSGPAAEGILNDFARRNSDLLTKPGAHIGTWADPKSGKTYLDVSSNIPRARDAISEGKRANQISIYDVKRKRTIDTGGTGK